MTSLITLTAVMGRSFHWEDAGVGAAAAAGALLVLVGASAIVVRRHIRVGRVSTRMSVRSLRDERSSDRCR